MTARPLNPPSSAPSRERFLALLREAVRDGSLEKITLGKHRGADVSLAKLSVRPVVLASGPRLSFVWRHATRDLTKNFSLDAGLAAIEPLVGGDFLHAHLFTARASAQLECEEDGSARLRVIARAGGSPGRDAHDQQKLYPIPADVPWLRDLGVTNDRGRPREGMTPKFRQIEKFAELLGHLLKESGLDAAPVRVTDMGCGKGYLTFAVAALLGERAEVRGIEVRPELVELCNRVAAARGLAPRLSFSAGRIEGSEVGGTDVLIALHACDTATDDALAKGVAAEARLLLVAPCCQKELRPRMVPPAVLAESLRHGIFLEREAEFVTDALRALLLEWAGYRARVFEFVSTEHTAKNIMIAGIRAHAPGDAARAARLREFAAFYGIRQQSLARQLGFDLAAE